MIHMGTAIAHRKTLPSVESFQKDLGLVHLVADGEQGEQHLLTSTEVGRLAGLPGVWSMKGHHMNLLAQAAGLAVRVNGRWEPTEQGESHSKKVDSRWRWYPSMIDQIKQAAKEHDLIKLSKVSQHE
jgi:hypothetical protein